MAFEELKDRFSSEAKMMWERIQGSSLYQQLKDKYDNLTPSQQKLTVIGLIVLSVFMVFSFPYTAWDSSASSVSEFESKRGLIRELFQVSKQSAEVPMIPPTPTGDSLVGQINNMLTGAQLLPEQIKGVTATNATTRLIPGALIDGQTTVTLAKLTLIQLIDIGHQLQAISPSLKMTDLTVQSNGEDTRYMDATFQLVALKVPAIPEPTVDIEPPPTKGRKKTTSEDE
ncbi:MAG: hypothetical protein V4736_00375 [Bdellovibrionota bacterium]